MTRAPSLQNHPACPGNPLLHMLCGAQTGNDVDLSSTPKGNSCNPSFLKLENGIPSHDTGSRLPGMLDPAAFQQCSQVLCSSLPLAAGTPAYWHRTGKPCAVLMTDRAEQLSPLHPVSAWAEAQRLVCCGDCRRCCTPDAAYHRPSAADRERAVAMYQEGGSLRAVGRVFGVSTQAVSR